MRTDIVFGLAQELSESKDLEQVKNVCQTFCEHFEIDTYAYLLRIPTSISQPDITLIQNYPQEWVTAYQDNQFIRDDPVVAYAGDHATPAVWSDIVRMDQYCKKKAKMVMSEAHQFGLKEGVALSYCSPSGDQALFSLGFDQTSTAARQAIGNSIMAAQHLNAYLYESVKTISLQNNAEQVQQYQSSITRRERECLLWACEGKTAWEIANIVGISERTAIFHLNNAAEKLGAANRQHAVAKAVLLGVIKPEFSLAD